MKRETMLRVSAACVTVELLIAASTLAPEAPLVPQWPQFLLFPLVFVIHFSSVLRLTTDRRRPRWRELLTGLPPALLLAFIILFIGAWLVLVSSIADIGGQPTMSGGRYYLDDHGTLIPVTHAAYQRALVLQQRIFTLGPSVFFALGVLAHYPRRSAGTEALAHG